VAGTIAGQIVVDKLTLGGTSGITMDLNPTGSFSPHESYTTQVMHSLPTQLGKAASDGGSIYGDPYHLYVRNGTRA